MTEISASLDDVIIVEISEKNDIKTEINTFLDDEIIVEVTEKNDIKTDHMSSLVAAGPW